MYVANNVFNAGELSPKMSGRVDVSQYGKGCSILQNFLVTPYGAVERRPGSKFVAMAKHSSGSVRLIPFVVSSEVGYIVEIGDYYMRFYRNDILVDELNSPYAEAEIYSLQWVQSADVVFMVHPDYPIQEISRVSEDVFSIDEMEWNYPPMLDPNVNDDLTITPSDIEGDITLEASGDIFEAGNVDGYFQIITTRESNDIYRDFGANGVSDSLEVYGSWTFTSHGTWSGVVRIQRSFDGGLSWGEYRSYSSAQDNNVSASGEEDTEDVLYRITMEDYEQSSTGTLMVCRVLFSNPDFVVNGLVKITSVTDSQNANATVIHKLGDVTATVDWDEGAFSDRRGYPCSIAFFEERLMLGGTYHKPNTVFGSWTNDWNKFILGDGDDNGLSFSLASDTVNNIVWMCQHDALVIGTEDSEWTLSASSSAEALSPTNVQFKRQSVYGSCGVPAKMVGDVVLFVQRQRRKVREFCYDIQKDGYTSPDLTIMADHITKVGIVEVALQQQPDTIFWCLLADGTLSAMTYERDQEVTGWHRHTTQGSYLAMCVIPDGGEDAIYTVVERSNGRMLERFVSREYESVQDCCFVDSAVVVNGDDITTIEGLDHLNDLEVAILADGAMVEPQTVANGKITLDTPAQDVVVGLAYDSILAPMPLEIETENGFSLLRRKSIAEVRIRVYDSVGGSVQVGEDSPQDIISRSFDDEVSCAIPLKSETVQLQVRSGYDTSLTITISQSAPLPLNVCTIVAIYEVAE